jgi:hypothetical protein
LGVVATEERHLAAARAWYLKSLAIEEKQGNEHGAAYSFGQLGILAYLEGRFPEAASWLLRAIGGFARTNDPDGAQRNANNYRIVNRKAPEVDWPQLRQMWIDAGLDPAFLDEAP